MRLVLDAVAIKLCQLLRPDSILQLRRIVVSSFLHSKVDSNGIEVSWLVIRHFEDSEMVNYAYYIWVWSIVLIAVEVPFDECFVEFSNILHVYPHLDQVLKVLRKIGQRNERLIQELLLSRAVGLLGYNHSGLDKGSVLLAAICCLVRCMVHYDVFTWVRFPVRLSSLGFLTFFECWLTFDSSCLLGPGYRRHLHYEWQHLSFLLLTLHDFKKFHSYPRSLRLKTQRSPLVYQTCS